MCGTVIKQFVKHNLWDKVMYDFLSTICLERFMSKICNNVL